MNRRKLYIAMAKSAVLFFSLLFITDRIIGYELKKIYFKQKDGDYYQTTYAIKSAKQQLLIFGSSRAEHHYVSPVFQEQMNESTYNLGRDGRNVQYCETIFSQILTYHHPKEVILDVMPDELSLKSNKEGSDVMTAALLPYANYPLISKKLEQKNKVDLLLSKLFWTYSYNSISLQVFGNYFGFLKSGKDIEGYKPLFGCKVSKLVPYKAPDPNLKFDSTLVNSFKNFIALAKKNNIQCYVVISPTNLYNSRNCVPYIKKIAEDYGVPFYDCSNLKMFKQLSLYYDDSHLNEKGALLFSNYMAMQLKKDAGLPGIR